MKALHAAIWDEKSRTIFSLIEGTFCIKILSRNVLKYDWVLFDKMVYVYIYIYV